MAYLTSVQFGVYCQPDISPEPEQLDMGNTFFFFVFCFVFLPFLGLLPWHREVPKLGVQSEL